MGEADVKAELLDKEGNLIPHYITGRVFENEGKKYIVGAAINISDRVAYEQELKESINEKQVLLQEIHHRVKNNLAVISGLLELQKAYSNQPQFDKALSESQLRIKSIALIHDKLYLSEKMSSISLDQIIGDLAQSAKHAIDIQNKVTIQSECPPLNININ